MNKAQQKKFYRINRMTTRQVSSGDKFNSGGITKGAIDIYASSWCMVRERPSHTAEIKKMHSVMGQSTGDPTRHTESLRSDGGMYGENYLGVAAQARRLQSQGMIL